MQLIKPDVSTICTGMAASMGAVLLCAGEKGKRSGLTHSRVMIHQPLGGAQGQASDIEITAETTNKTIMGLKHKKHDIHGVQFHPESINTKVGLKLIKNFLKNFKRVFVVMESRDIFRNCSTSKKLFSILRSFNASEISSKPWLGMRFSLSKEDTNSCTKFKF